VAEGTAKIAPAGENRAGNTPRKVKKRHLLVALNVHSSKTSEICRCSYSIPQIRNAVNWQNNTIYSISIVYFRQHLVVFGERKCPKNIPKTPKKSSPARKKRTLGLTDAKTQDIVFTHLTKHKIPSFLPKEARKDGICIKVAKNQIKY
jgi:hypothetical protein